MSNYSTGNNNDNSNDFNGPFVSYEIAIFNIGAFISSISLVLNISYFIVSVFKKRKEEYTNTRFLSTQFLISSITCCLYINFYNYYLAYESKKVDPNQDVPSLCFLIVILRTLSITPTICSCACVAVSTFLVINKRHLLKQNSRVFRIVFILLGWGPSIIVVISLIFRFSAIEIEKQACTQKGNFFSYLTFSYQMCYLLVLYIVCAVVLHGICKLNSQGDIEIKKAIKQLIQKVVGYMVGISFFSIFAIFTNVNQLDSVDTNTVLPYFQLLFSVMDPVMAHLFIVNHKFMNDWKNFYLCKKEPAEINEDIQEGSQNLKLKSSINQQEDDDDDDDDE